MKFVYISRCGKTSFDEVRKQEHIDHLLENRKMFLSYPHTNEWPNQIPEKCKHCPYLEIRDREEKPTKHFPSKQYWGCAYYVLKEGESIPDGLLNMPSNVRLPSEYNRYLIFGGYTGGPIGCCSEEGLYDCKAEEPEAKFKPVPERACPLMNEECGTDCPGHKDYRKGDRGNE